MLNRLIRLFNNKQKVTELGRWKINYSNHVIKYKVEMANEDNCGSCGEYLKKSIAKTDINTSSKLDISNKANK